MPDAPQVAPFPPIYDSSFAYLMSNEGGFSDNPNDTGGATKFGITKTQYPDIDIPSLTIDQAKVIYYSQPPKGSPSPFWLPNYSRVTDWRVAAKIFDMAANMGPGTAHEIVQMALGMKSPTQVFGQVSLGMTNSAAPATLLVELAARCAVHYAQVMVKNPDDSDFALGWMRRAVKLPG